MSDSKRLDFDESRFIDEQKLMDVLVQCGFFTPEQNINPLFMSNPTMIIDKFNELFYNASELMGVNFKIFSSDLFAFYLSLKNESDRGSALIVAAFLDRQLEELLTEYLVEDKKVLKEFLKGTGGLSSFEARIDIIYLLGLISSTMRRDLHLIRKIRNNFAHDLDISSFNNDSIKDKCSELTFNLIEEDLTSRGRFIRVGISLAGAISGKRLNIKRLEKMEEPKISEVNISDFIDEMLGALNQSINKKIADD